MFRQIVLLAAASVLAGLTAGCVVPPPRHGHPRGYPPPGYAGGPGYPPPGYAGPGYPGRAPYGGRRTVWRMSPQPAASSFRCTADGTPAPLGAVGPGYGWCTPHGPRPAAYSEPQYGYGAPPQHYEQHYSSGAQYGGESHYGYGATYYGPQRYRYDRPMSGY